MKHTKWIAVCTLSLGIGGCDDHDRAPYADLSREDGGSRAVLGVPSGSGDTPSDGAIDAPASRDSGTNSNFDASVLDASERDALSGEPDATVTIDATMPLDAANVPQP